MRLLSFLPIVRTFKYFFFVDIDSQYSDREIIFLSGIREDTENPKYTRIFVDFLDYSW
jgi:hypothetical protein